MSSEFLLRNRVSDFSSASDTNNQSNGSHGNNEFGQTAISHDVASNILVPDLAIRSAAFNASSSSSSTSGSKSLNKASDEEDEEHNNSKKAKRRVTFNMDNVQVQTIPIYLSCSSDDSYESGNSVEDEDEDYFFFPPTRTDVTPLLSPPYPPSPSSPSSLPSLSSTSSPASPCSPSTPSTQITLPTAQPANSIVSEQISKKASYDALQQRHCDNSTNISTTKPGYWYPLNVTTSGMARRVSPLPTLQSLEMTERLITESIQRELALNPNLLYHAAAKRTSYNQEASITATPPRSTIINNDAVSMLITDTDDGDDDGDDDEHSVEEKSQNHNDKTGIVINDEHPNTRNSPEFFSPVLIDDDEESDTSETTSLAEPQAKYNQEKEQKGDFTKSVYDELAKRHNPAVIPIPENKPLKLTFPFQQDLIPISAHNNLVIIPPLQNNDNPAWVDDSLLAEHTVTHGQLQTRDIFFVKVLEAENLDFPIENDDTSVYCSIRYKSTASKSDYQKMAHTMTIDHEMRILDVDPNEQIEITIHVAATQNNKITQQSSSSWYHRTKAPSDLQRYVHEKDGSICQTLFSPGRFMTDNSLVGQPAFFMLVNNWYRTMQHATKTSLLLQKTSTLMKKKPARPAVIAREKAVGKIQVQCLYLKIQGNYTPRNLDEGMEALNAKRFHNINWKSGYLSQLGGNVKQSKRRFFKLIGGFLFAYLDTTTKDNQPLYKIPLLRVTRLICDNLVIVEIQQRANPTALVSHSEDALMLDENEEDNKAANQENGTFQLVFDNGDLVHFGCESFEERNKWVSVMEIIIRKLPPLPDWIMN